MESVLQRFFRKSSKGANLGSAGVSVLSAVASSSQLENSSSAGVPDDDPWATEDPEEYEKTPPVVISPHHQHSLRVEEHLARMDEDYDYDRERLDYLYQQLSRGYDQEVSDEIEEIEYRLSHYEAERDHFLRIGHLSAFTRRPLPVNMTAAERDMPLFSVAAPSVFVAIKRTRIAFLKRILSNLTVQMDANDLHGCVSAAAAAEAHMQTVRAEHWPQLQSQRFQLSKEGLRARWQVKVAAAYEALDAAKKRWGKFQPTKAQLDHLGDKIAEMKSHKACMDADELSSDPSWVADVKDRILHHTWHLTESERNMSASMQALRTAEVNDVTMTRLLKACNSELGMLQSTGPTSVWAKPLKSTMYVVTDHTIAEEFPQFVSEIEVLPACLFASSGSAVYTEGTVSGTAFPAASNSSASSVVVTASGGAGASSDHSTEDHACACNSSSSASASSAVASNDDDDDLSAAASFCGLPSFSPRAAGGAGTKAHPPRAGGGGAKSHHPPRAAGGGSKSQPPRRATGGGGNSSSGGNSSASSSSPSQLQIYLEMGACLTCGSCNGWDEPPCRCNH